MSLFALMCVIYFTVSGGAFGVEPLIGAVGPGWAVLLIVGTGHRPRNHPRTGIIVLEMCSYFLVSTFLSTQSANDERGSKTYGPKTERAPHDEPWR